MKDMISVAQALALVLDGAEPLVAQTVPLHEAAWRLLAGDLHALRTHPPFPSAAMDGYAIGDGEASAGTELTLIGQSAAGRSFSGSVQSGSAVRIFTGAPVPDGAYTVVMQEDVTRLSDTLIRLNASVTAGRHIRARGLDFEMGARLLKAGTVLDPSCLSLAAAGGHAHIPVIKRPRIAIVATGSELVLPGDVAGPDSIIATNSVAVSALARKEGADVVDLGIVPDDENAIASAVSGAFDDGADILVTIGGASVGDHDLVKPVFAKLGVRLGFWQVAMRPGKPLVQGRFGKAHVLGLPGNPVSSLVCAHLFLRPLIARLAGLPFDAKLSTASLGAALNANDHRQDYVRAQLMCDKDGLNIATPHAVQDSSMLSTLAASDCLIVRAPYAPPAQAGQTVTILPLR